MSEVPSQIVQKLRNASNILVLTHVYPDGDALGSQLAFGEILSALGKKFFLFGEEKVSYIYDFLPGCEVLGADLPDLAEFDCVVALDCGDCHRLGRKMAEVLAVTPFIMIDHHAGNKLFGDMHWVDSKRASTGEMVYDLAIALGAEISYAAAFCLYTAIVSDTGSFKYSSTTAGTFRVAGELVARGVMPSEVAGKLFDNFTVNRLRLLRMVLDSLELHDKARIAFISVTAEMFNETGATQADTESFINYPRSLSSVNVAVFFKESANNIISVSLRSKGTECDVAEIAAGFGGGGHRNAAGFKMPGAKIAEVKTRLLKVLLTD
ncbi:MAG: bifunctional oligoribonuclease/PAP phosphatase NrnA [Proteobacteria bacterium]|nr:bifunctional oligoribonuclease/PAP phosphatase NrnA [Pseudomonadota bacterium]MBU1716199.1 bifunctional oligoribonuclease/PAP phosphatase NrnA [Pseudomonadota bacterium]